jgi:type VI secretion system protein ImpE
MDQVKACVRKAPEQAAHRAAYFQLLCVQGEWEKALDQIALVEDLDAESMLFAQTYGRALRCEAERRRVHAGAEDPVIFGEPAEWMGLLIEAFRQGRAGNWPAALQAQELAFAAAPATPGHLNGEAIEWIADVDVRYGPVLEAFVEGHYRWVPFQSLSGLAITPPRHLIDLVWLQAKFALTNGGSMDGLVPARYFGSEKAEGEAIRRAEATDWREVAPGRFVGLGHRCLCSDVSDIPVAQVASLHLAAHSES